MTHEQCEIVSAWATLATAIITFLTVVVAVLAMWGSSKDAKKARDEQSRQAKHDREQQKKIFQANVMSACMQEFFAIRKDASQAWRDKNATSEDKSMAAEHYSERSYGLHFEQYHLFRQQAIPCHVYAIWIKALLDEIKDSLKHSPGANQLYPPVNITKYLEKNSDADFRAFFDDLQAHPPEQIGALVKKEWDRGGLD